MAPRRLSTNADSRADKRLAELPAAYNPRMYIVAIAWLWVALMMAISEANLVAGALSFTFYGLLPCALLMWLAGTPLRRRQRRDAEKAAPQAPEN